MSSGLNTPMMKQFLALKKEHKDSVLLFRMGDFYETFLDDAKKVSGILGITLTSRQKKNDNGGGIPLAGFPYHALDGYLTKLVKAGCRVAVCEQTEDPKKAKGLVKRDVIEIVTPGTLVSGSALEKRKTAFLSAVSVLGKRAAISICDLSTGDIRATEIHKNSLNEELARLAPREVLISDKLSVSVPDDCEVTILDEWKFDSETAEREIEHIFGKAASDGFGLSGSKVLLSAMGALLTYIGHTKRSEISHLEFRGLFQQSDFLLINRNSSRALGIVEAPPGEEDAILANRIDRTKTSSGARLLRSWLLSPEMNSRIINGRYSAVEDLILSGNHYKIRDILSEIADLERQTGKLGTMRSTPRDLRAIYDTSVKLPQLKLLLFTSPSKLLGEVSNMDPLTQVAEQIDRTLAIDPPARLTDGGYIRDGFSEELDSLREIKTGGRKWMNNMLKDEQEKTGIKKLSVGYNRVFGYYLEVTKSNSHLVPNYFIRKQTLVNAERFITPELKEKEQQILSADDNISHLESEIYQTLLKDISLYISQIKDTGRTLSVLDVLCSFAAIASEKAWVKPSISEEVKLEIVDGRHPVLENILPIGECVPNDLNLSSTQRILLVTGPNMAGKSTYLRQAALLVILAQCGSFVPAASMTFSLVDRIYTRIGSADRLTKGQSTFLVEMAEAASLLNGSTEKSLAILDEVGRGTSTYDGLSIAWAMVEYLHDNVEHRPQVLFATHYHELTSLASKLPMCKNANVVVKETGNKIAFLYKVEDGSANRSYGVHVASMAGVPGSVVKRAKKVLADLEAGKHLLPTGSTSATGQMSLPLANPEHPILEEIRKMTPDSLTPLKSLELIYSLKKMLD